MAKTIQPVPFLDLRAQIIRHLGTRCLVLGEDLIPGGLAGVEGHRQVFGFLLLQQA